MSVSGKYRVCVDTGGTFTDCVVMSPDGALHEFKSPSTPPDFSIGVLNSLREAADGFGVGFEHFIRETELIVHGTTAATNALVTRNVAKTALVTTEGFRDIIEIRRSLKIETRSMYEAYIPPYEPLVPRRRRFGVKEKTSPAGVVDTAVDETELCELAAHLRDIQVEAVSVCFINSYANTENEQRACEILERELGDSVFVTGSCELLAKLGEYERESSSIISACLGPIVRTYLDNLERTLLGSGFDGQLLIMQANQYAQSVQAVSRKPAYLMGSGPAAAPAGAALLGELIDEPNLITADMGGTTLDVSVVTNGVVSLSSGQWLGDDRLGLKVVDVCSIAAGGGSIGWIDALGLLKVGPQSAGADPGPACFNKGGAAPTITDAAVVLGYVPFDNFWNGKMILDVEKAKVAVSTLADDLGLSIEDTAQAMFDVVSAEMGDGTAEVTTRQGHDVRDYALLAIGGAGPLCSAMIADKLGMERVIVPNFSASFSAWSMFSLDIGRDYLRSYPIELGEADLEHIEEIFEEMSNEAADDLAILGVERDDIRFERSADLRYKGQYHELEVALSEGPATASGLEELAGHFAELHKKVFTFDLPTSPIFLRSLRLIAKVKTPNIAFDRIEAGGADSSQAIKQQRAAYFDSAWRDVNVYDHDRFQAGNTFDGPCVIEGPTTTIVVPGNFSGTVDQFGNLVLTRQ